MRESIGYLAALLSVRLVQLGLLVRFTGGRRVTSDIDRWLQLAEAPWRSMFDPAMHDCAPLVGIGLALPIRPWLGLLPDEVACRLGLVFWEIVAASFVLATLRVMRPQARSERVGIVMLWALAPVTWMTSVVAAQDEVIVTAAMAAALYAWTRQRFVAAGVLAALATVGGKVFAVLMVASMFAAAPSRRLRHIVMATVPILGLGYGGQWLASIVQGGSIPLWSFRPPIDFGSSAWTWLVREQLVDVSLARGLSSLLCVLAVSWVIAGTRGGGGVPDDSEGQGLVSTWAAATLLVLLLFYHVNPEYYLMVIPAVFVSPYALRTRAFVVFALSVPWLVNISYAALWRIEAGLKDPISGLFLSARSAEMAHEVSLALTVGATLGAVAWALMWWRHRRRRPISSRA